MQRDFEELPAQAADALRASLLDLLIRFATGATAVRTQLCLAIAAMAAHIPSKQWGQGGVVMWLAENLGRQSQEVALPCMLELLTVIPEASPWDCYKVAVSRCLPPCLLIQAEPCHSMLAELHISTGLWKSLLTCPATANFKS